MIWNKVMKFKKKQNSLKFLAEAPRLQEEFKEKTEHSEACFPLIILQWV